jgi:hypothetical protein
VRVAKVLETLLGITGIVVESAEIGPAPKGGGVRCAAAPEEARGAAGAGSARRATISARLGSGDTSALGATRIWLRYAPRRGANARSGRSDQRTGSLGLGRGGVGSARRSRKPRPTWLASLTRPR